MAFTVAFVVISFLNASVLVSGLQVRIPSTIVTRFKPSRLFVSVEKTEEEWESQLSPQAFIVLRKEGTESPWSSDLNAIEGDGTFECVGCASPLFRTTSKFDSGTGWPSFFQPVDNDAIELVTDYKLILPRTECRCASCGGHLGHVFPDGPDPTGQRYCMNGVAMNFLTDEDADPDLVAELISREAATIPLKPNPMLVLPTALIYGGLSAAYINGFWSNYQLVQGAGNSHALSTFDYFPLVIAAVCGFFATRDLKRLF